MPIAAIAAIGVAGSIAGGAIASHGANKAAQTQADASLQATRESNQMLQKQYDTTRTDQMPWMTGGAGALGRLDYLLGINGNPTGSTAQNYSANYGPQGAAPVSGYGAPASGPVKRTPTMGPISSNFNGGLRYNAAQPSFQTTNPANGQPLNLSYSGAPIGDQSYNSYNPQSFSGTATHPQILHALDPGMDIGGGAGYRTPSTAPGGIQRPGVSPAAVAGGQAPPSGAQNNGDFGSLMRNFSTADFNTDPGYQFRLSEGAKSLERSAAANGGLFSGGTLKALDQYNQGFASNEFQNAYNRYNNNRTMQYNFLGGRAGMGQQTAQQLGTTGSMLTGQMAQNTNNGINNAAAARASGYIGSANAWQGALGGGLNALNWYTQNRGSRPSGGSLGGAA